MLRSIVTATIAAAGLAASASAAIFSSSGLAVIQAGDGGTINNNAVYSVLELTKAPAQVAPVQTISISGQAVNPMWTSASATSTAYLSASDDRSSLVFSGHTVRNTIGSNNNAILPRAVATIDVNGNYAQNIAYTGTSGQQTRSGLVFSSIASPYTLATDQAGLYTAGGVAPALVANIRNTRIFGGTGYALRQSGTVGTNVIASVDGTPTAPTLTGLPGLSNNNAAQDFYMLDSTGTGLFDLLYITTNSSATAGSILKFNLVEGTWVARGSAVTTGLFALAAELQPTGGVSLFATSGNGATGANSVLAFTDASGAGSNINLSASTTLFTAATGFTLKGIELAPVPTPGAASLLALGGLLAARRRRN